MLYVYLISRPIYTICDIYIYICWRNDPRAQPKNTKNIWMMEAHKPLGATPKFRYIYIYIGWHGIVADVLCTIHSKDIDAPQFLLT